MDRHLQLEVLGMALPGVRLDAPLLQKVSTSSHKQYITTYIKG